MPYKSLVSVLTNQNATETNKSLIDTVVVPQGVSRLIGVGTQVSLAGITTLEDYTHILEVESDDMSPWGGTQQFLGFGLCTALTSGSVPLNPYIHPTNISVIPGARLKVSTTFNKPTTINPGMRVQLVFE